jgi:hypothetical protein
MSGKLIATAERVGFLASGGAAVARSVADKLGEVVSIRDFGADGTGVVDCSAILADMLAAGHSIIFFPPGTYRFPTKVDVQAGTALIGAGWQDCEVIAEGDWWVECWRNHAPNVTTDWCRCTVTGFLIRMAEGGIRFWGHEFRASELRFAGGGAHMDMADPTTWVADPEAWCIEGIAANEIYLGRISGGYGGNNAINTLFANGIRLTALDVDATEDLANYLEPPASGQNQRGVNYGDGLVEEISLKGRCRDWVGLEISHQSTSTGVQNMLQAQRLQLQASDVPASLESDPTMAVEVSAGLYTWKGSVGVRLERVRRFLFEAVNTETSEVAWDLIGSYRLDGEGNPIQTISTERNSFIACPTMNSVTNYRDNNAAITGAVKDNHFQGGQSFGPLQPTGVSTDPAEGGNAIMAGVLDTYLPGQLWFSRTQTGLPHAWLRFSPSQDFLLGVAGSPDPGNTLEDSHPRNDHLPRGILDRPARLAEARHQNRQRLAGLSGLRVDPAEGRDLAVDTLADLVDDGLQRPQPPLERAERSAQRICRLLQPRRELGGRGGHLLAHALNRPLRPFREVIACLLGARFELLHDRERRLVEAARHLMQVRAQTADLGIQVLARVLQNLPQVAQRGRDTLHFAARPLLKLLPEVLNQFGQRFGVLLAQAAGQSVDRVLQRLDGPAEALCHVGIKAAGERVDHLHAHVGHERLRLGRLRALQPQLLLGNCFDRAEDGKLFDSVADSPESVVEAAQAPVDDEGEDDRARECGDRDQELVAGRDQELPQRLLHGRHVAARRADGAGRLAQCGHEAEEGEYEADADHVVRNGLPE